MPFKLADLLRSYPFTTHKFHDFRPGQHAHITYAHALEHPHFCKEVYCSYHRQYKYY